VGAYRNDEGKPMVLPSVRMAEERIVARKLDKEYAPIEGFAPFIQKSLEFVYGKDCEPLKTNRIAAVQSISGTGGLRVATDFLARFGPLPNKKQKTVYLPNPTWGNHLAILRSAGLTPAYYPYYRESTKKVDFPSLLKFIKEETEEESVFLFHACAHNPTGCDLSEDQWSSLSQVLKERNHLILLDIAYQGFASGDPEKDAFAVRKLVNDGHQILLTQSFAKVSLVHLPFTLLPFLYE
jgi:aspartate aminotransferase